MMSNDYTVKVGEDWYTYVSDTGDIEKNGHVWEKNIYTDFTGISTRMKLDITEEQWIRGEVVQSLWLSISHICNMVCEYCFAQDGTYGTASLMNWETAKRAIDFFFEYLKKDVRKIRVNFFGGEPLLNKEVFLKSVEYINEKAQKIEKPVRYIITTNSTIIDNEIISIFKDNNFMVNASIDGDVNAQNSSRRFKDGKETYSIVWKNIMLLVENGIEVIARVTITKKNLRFFRESVLKMWKAGIEYVQFAPVQTDDENLKLDIACLKKFEQDLAYLVKFSNQSADNGKRCDLGNITEYENRIASRLILKECRFFNSFTIICAPDGKIYNCNRIIGNKDYEAGSVFEGIKWEKLKKDYNCPEICKRCWARHLCGGGCHLTNDELSCLFNKIVIDVALKDYITEKNRKSPI
ncbi:MAG: radical SAM protein [Lachnospiraceae bacterium]|jgi:uncharacterized protein